MTHPNHEALVQRLNEDVLMPMKRAFVGKDEVIDLLGVCLVARENLFIFGPPGTAKSALVQDLARRIEGRVFDYLLTRFTEPNEIFGPFDIRQLRDGNLVTNTEGMLPEAAFVFLDELLNANSAILNSLLMVLNERIFRRGRETKSLPTLMVVGASNRLPEDDGLRALFDRFLLRVNCNNVGGESLAEVLHAGWQLEQRVPYTNTISVDQVVEIQALADHVSFNDVSEKFVETVLRLRAAGIEISDRRAVKLQRVIASSAVLCGRTKADISDLWVLRYIWDSVEQQEILNSLVNKAIESNAGMEITRHPLASTVVEPDPELIARDLEILREKLKVKSVDRVVVERCKDQLAILSGQVQWIKDQQQREFLEQFVESLWVEAKDQTRQVIE